MELLRTILAGCLVAGLLSPTGADERRDVRLDGQPNFRDLGGYKTSDGRTVKSGLIFRSGELPRLTDDDVSKLQELGIKTVVNFLTDAEISAHGQDRLPDGTRRFAIPMTGGIAGDLAGEVRGAIKSADFSKVPTDLNPEIHRILIRDVRREYAAFLRAVVDPANRPVVFHCSHGVHRTGTGAAILLSALGVPWETVRKDYLLSNRYRREEVEKRLTQLRQQAAKNQDISPDEVDMTNMKAFYILKAEYIDASLDEAVTKYGSMEEYIRKGLGIDDALIEKLRNELLESPSSTPTGKEPSLR